MSLTYTIHLENPGHHFIKVVLQGQLDRVAKNFSCYLPLWWPGLPGPQEASRFIRYFKAETLQGEVLYHEHLRPGYFAVDWEKLPVKKKEAAFRVTYEIYAFANPMEPNASHVNEFHAFLFGPSYLMAVEGQEQEEVVLNLRFPPLWSKVSTALRDISPRREIFVYQAPHYTHLVETPLEIGCHETDGFHYEGRDHELAYRGNRGEGIFALKKDLLSLVKTTWGWFGAYPFPDRYLFLFDFLPKATLSEGLFFPNGQFTPAEEDRLKERSYLSSWMSQVAERYIGAFLGYQGWSKALSAFAGKTLLLKMDFWDRRDFLEDLRGRLNQFLATPGRRFCSLPDSWAREKFHKTEQKDFDLNFHVDGKLKGELSFFLLSILLFQAGRPWKEFLKKASVRKSLPSLLSLVGEMVSPEAREKWEVGFLTTEDIPFEKSLQAIGLGLSFEESPGAWIGLHMEGIRVVAVELDSPAYRAGLNRGDEILGFGDLKVTAENFPALVFQGPKGKTVPMVISRWGRLLTLEVTLAAAPRRIKEVGPLLQKEQVFEKFFRFFKEGEAH